MKLFLSLSLALSALLLPSACQQGTASHVPVLPEIVVAEPPPHETPASVSALLSDRLPADGLWPYEFPGLQRAEQDELYTLAACGETRKLEQEMDKHGILRPGQRLLHLACAAGNAKTLRWALARGCQPETGQNYWGSILSGDRFGGCDRISDMMDEVALPLAQALVAANPDLLQEETCALFLGACRELEMQKSRAFLLQRGVREPAAEPSSH